MLDPSQLSAARTAPGDLTGRRIAGRYRLVELIASGGMAQVWQADDEVLARPVAVKLLHPALAADRAFVARFRAEAVAAARLSHPSIVSIYDTCADDGLEAIVMELVRGMTLRDLLDHRGRLDPPDAITVGVEVAEALATAHRSGLVHRDVKPANVLLSEDGRVLVADFGIAKASEDADATRELHLMGTARYLAPEQVDGGPVDYRADLYALGLVVYEMVCGSTPFVAETDAATALARLHADPVPARVHCPEASPALEAAIGRAVSRRVEDRFPTAEALRDALLDAERAHDAEPVTAAARADPPAVGRGRGGDRDAVAAPRRAVPIPPRATGARRRLPATRRLTDRPWFLPALVGAILLVALAVIAVIVSRGDDDPAREPASSTSSPTTPSSAAVVPPSGAAPLQVTGAAAFDPFGDNRTENDALAAAAVDDDPESAWETEVYGNPDITRVKPGVGLTVTVDRPLPIAELVVTSPTDGWSATIYASESGPGADLAAWGEPVGQQADLAAGTTRFDLGGRPASAVLIWITRTGEDGVVAITDVGVAQ